jgi:hypothetical protein
MECWPSLSFRYPFLILSTLSSSLFPFMTLLPTVPSVIAMVSLPNLEVLFPPLGNVTPSVVSFALLSILPLWKLCRCTLREGSRGASSSCCLMSGGSSLGPTTDDTTLCHSHHYHHYTFESRDVHTRAYGTSFVPAILCHSPGVQQQQMEGKTVPCLCCTCL